MVPVSPLGAGPSVLLRRVAQAASPGSAEPRHVWPPPAVLLALGWRGVCRERGAGDAGHTCDCDSTDSHRCLGSDAGCCQRRCGAE